MSAADKVKADATIPAYIPTADQKAALVGTEGTPSSSNPFVTNSDSRIATAVDTADLSNWASMYVMYGAEKATGQTSRNWKGMAAHGGELYAAVINGDIYKMDIDGVFQPTGQTSRAWYGLASHDGDLYACVHSGDIYKMDGSGVFQPTGQTSRHWYQLASHDGDLYATVYSGDIYKMDGSGVFQSTGQTSRSWVGLESHDGDLYATVEAGDIYKMDGSGVFQPTGQTSRAWYEITSHDGELYASVDNGDIYTMDGSGVFQPTGQTAAYRYGMASHEDVLYACVSGGDVYTLTNKDPSINLPAVGKIYIPSDFPIGGRKVFRRTAAYDGNPVTISPPSGATFEGRASLSLYGQYSYVELERISSTVFSIKALDDNYTITPTISFGGASTGITYAFNTGDVRVVKGRAYVNLRVSLSSKGTDIGAVAIALGYAPPHKPSGVNRVPASVYMYNVTYTGQYGAQMSAGSSLITVGATAESGAQAVLTDANFTNTSTLMMAIEYPI